MATTTPLLRIRQVDSIEQVTDFQSASDHSLSLEKFQEMRIPMTLPVQYDKEKQIIRTSIKSVFEENMDFTTQSGTDQDNLRWKFKGPWLARMPEGDFISYIDKKVRPRRSEFRKMLKQRLADELTAKQNLVAMDLGKETPPIIEAKEVTAAQFTEYMNQLRNNRVLLYAIVSKFLDLAPLGTPVGFTAAAVMFADQKVPNNVYGKSGPPPSHPSAGISYLRTGSFMENHPVYGPQAKKTPVLSRIVSPRQGPSGAKLGVGGFVAPVPHGDNDFNMHGRHRRRVLTGIEHLDIQAYGGGKVLIEPFAAKVDPEGKVVLDVKETSEEAQMVAKEAKGMTNIYGDHKIRRVMPRPAPYVVETTVEEEGIEALQSEPEKEIVSSSRSYGLGAPEGQGEEGEKPEGER